MHLFFCFCLFFVFIILLLHRLYLQFLFLNFFWLGLLLNHLWWLLFFLINHFWWFIFLFNRLGLRSLIHFLLIWFDLSFNNWNSIKSYRLCTIKLSQWLNRFQNFYRILFFLCLVALAHSAHLPWRIDRGMIHSHCTLFRHYCFGYLRFCIVHGLFFGFIHDLLFTFWNFNRSVSFLCSRNRGSLVYFLGSLSLNGLIYFFWSWLLNGTLWLIFLIRLAFILVSYRCFIISQWMV